MIVLAPPLDSISKRARPYPAYLLPEHGTALALFSAAYLGHNDVIHFARAEMHTTCVDIDAQRLDAMAEVYPYDWDFVVSDAWEYAEQAEETWDVVSVDTFTGDATDRSLQTLDLWCSLAEKLVTATIADGQTYQAPDGWKADVFPRSDRASWLVLTRD